MSNTMNTESHNTNVAGNAEYIACVKALMVARYYSEVVGKFSPGILRNAYKTTLEHGDKALDVATARVAESNARTAK